MGVGGGVGGGVWGGDLLVLLGWREAAEGGACISLHLRRVFATGLQAREEPPLEHTRFLFRFGGAHQSRRWMLLSGVCAREAPRSIGMSVQHPLTLGGGGVRAGVQGVDGGWWG